MSRPRRHPDPHERAPRVPEASRWSGRDLARSEGFEAFSPWLGWGLAPAAWALHQGVGYAMTGWLCDSGTRWPYHTLTLVAVAMCAAGLMAALEALRRARRIRPRRSAARMRMMALVGLMLCAAALGGIVTEYLPTFWIHACTGVPR
ncbi:hypothetical protein [Frigidibacter sp. MR17.24]|uniref:hypothetical protein n=1 Tax=Frigidibacter sp. MR17.24 TaxID=3127345 RepID=UPI00301313B6